MWDVGSKAGTLSGAEVAPGVKIQKQQSVTAMLGGPNVGRSITAGPLSGRNCRALLGSSAVRELIVVRPARIQDVEMMARVVVTSWQETYRGLVSDGVLDDPGLLAARIQFWIAALTDESSPRRRVAVAERGGQVIGVAMSGPPQDADAVWSRQLYVLYVYADDHGTGAGAGLLTWVVPPTESAVLWVAGPNPRAQAFYRRHGFLPDGASAVEEGIRVIRMVRAQPSDPEGGVVG